VKKIVVLTGAGVSAESGVPTFRDAGGLWEGHRIEEVATPHAFERNPELVHHFYNQRRADVQTRNPNAAHLAIAKLQLSQKCNVTLVTQNVDDLHERGGCVDVLHMHGELLRIRCEFCGMKSRWNEPLNRSIVCAQCQRPGDLRPDIVWFGEMPYFLDRIDDALKVCDLFVAIGTSGVVYPAAGFVDVANRRGIPSIEFNLKQTELSSIFTECRPGPATETISLWVEQLLSEA
jgi:NAD-dependent deacetylase